MDNKIYNKYLNEDVNFSRTIGRLSTSSVDVFDGYNLLIDDIDSLLMLYIKKTKNTDLEKIRKEIINNSNKVSKLHTELIDIMKKLSRIYP